MSKLREKFSFLDEYDEGGVIYCHNVEQCEQITDDFSVKFFDWANVNAYKFPTKTTTQELLQIFKTNIYGKE